MDKILKTTQTFETKSLNDNGDYVIVEGYATTYDNVDLDGDVIVKGAFDESLKETQPIVLWQHDQREPLGKGEYTSDDKGVYLKAMLPKSDSFVMGRVVPQLENKTVNSFSIGFGFQHEWVDYKTVSNKLVRYFLKGALYETSLVTFPANPKAKIDNFIKSVGASKSLPLADSDMDWDSTKAIQNIREYTNSKESPSNEYKKAFFWYDPENKDNFTAYKLPFADVVDGELKAVPKALSAVVGALNGARNGVNGISDSELSAIKSLVTSYYEKMGKPNPFDSSKCFNIETVKKYCESKQDLEDYFRMVGLSKNASTYLVNLTNLPTTKHDWQGELANFVKEMKNRVN